MRSPPPRPIPAEAERLRQRCHQLIEMVARQPYSVRRLGCILQAAEMAWGYKNRSRASCDRNPTSPKIYHGRT